MKVVLFDARTARKNQLWPKRCKDGTIWIWKLELRTSIWRRRTLAESQHDLEGTQDLNVPTRTKRLGTKPKLNRKWMLPRSSTSRSYFEVKPIQSQQVPIARRMRQSRVYPGGWQPTSAAHIIYNRWCHAYFRLTEQDEKKIMIIKI